MLFINLLCLTVIIDISDSNTTVWKEPKKKNCWPFCITCLWSHDTSYWRHTSLKDLTVVGATYQTILNHLTLQSCQLCDVAHDFRYDTCILKSVDSLAVSSCASNHRHMILLSAVSHYFQTYNLEPPINNEILWLKSQDTVDKIAAQIVRPLANYESDAEVDYQHIIQVQTSEVCN